MTKIFINAGHGHPDPGAVGQTGLTEAAVAWSIAVKTADYLQKAGYDAVAVQSDDLSGVIRKANVWDASLFLSIHCNSFHQEQANGTETLCHPASVKGRNLASKIQDQLIGEFNLTNRGVKTRTDLGVLNLTNMPAALAELAFISNTWEECLLANEHDRWARALARGVSDYYAAY